MSAMKIQLGYIMIGIIGLFFIGYLVYSNVYQKKINKRLKRNESMTHISMVSAENVGKTLMLVGTIIIFILIMAKLSLNCFIIMVCISRIIPSSFSLVSSRSFFCSVR